MNNKVRGLVSIILGITVFLVLYYGAQALMREATTPAAQPASFTVDRETYIQSCSYWAKQEPDTEGITDSMVRTYCGCVYDKGIAQYGLQGFIQVDSELTRTGQVTPELNAIVNQCIQEML